MQKTLHTAFLVPADSLSMNILTEVIPLITGHKPLTIRQFGCEKRGQNSVKRFDFCGLFDYNIINNKVLRNQRGGHLNNRFQRCRWLKLELSAN